MLGVVYTYSKFGENFSKTDTFFYFLRWQLIEKRSYFSKIRILINKTTLASIFFCGLHIITSSKTYYNLPVKGENYQLEIFLFYHCCGTDCFLNQSNFFDQSSQRKTKQKQKLNVGKNLLNLKISKNRAI